jgi:hypothetical protein
MIETGRLDDRPVRSDGQRHVGQRSSLSRAEAWLSVALHAPAWLALALLDTIGRFRGHSLIEALDIDASAGPERFGFRAENAPYGWTYQASQGGVPATFRTQRDGVRAFAATLVNVYANGADEPTLIGTLGQRLPASSRGFRATLAELAPEWFPCNRPELRLVTGSGPLRFFLSDGPTLQGSPDAFLELATRLLGATNAPEGSGQLSIVELQTGQKQEQSQLLIVWASDATSAKSADGEPTNPEVPTVGSA